MSPRALQLLRYGLGVGAGHWLTCRNTDPATVSAIKELEGESLAEFDREEGYWRVSPPDSPDVGTKDQPNVLAFHETKEDKTELYVRSQGKLIRVLAIGLGDAAANSYLAKHADTGVVAERKQPGIGADAVLIGGLYDHGLKIEKQSK